MDEQGRQNWGRWGNEDERGTLNLIDADIVRAAAGLVKRGRVYSLAVDLDRSGPISRSRNPLWHRTSLNLSGDDIDSGSADDVIVMHTHGTTHVDALCHVFYGNQMYNGYPVNQVITPTGGASRNGVQNIVSLVGRGVLLDVAGFRGVEHLDKSDEITPDELDACARALGVEIRPGDIVLIRTGWLRVFHEDRELFDSGAPGPKRPVGDWFRRHDLCALGADNVAVEKSPRAPGESLWLHLDVIRDLGGYLLEFVYLEELAADRVYEFMFVAAPLRLVGGIGSPINPLAIC
jgi:kynurenine formamidase